MTYTDELQAMAQAQDEMGFITVYAARANTTGKMQSPDWRTLIKQQAQEICQQSTETQECCQRAFARAEQLIDAAFADTATRGCMVAVGLSGEHEYVYPLTQPCRSFAVWDTRVHLLWLLNMIEHERPVAAMRLDAHGCIIDEITADHAHRVLKLEHDAERPEDARAMDKHREGRPGQRTATEPAHMRDERKQMLWSSFMHGIAPHLASLIDTHGWKHVFVYANAHDLHLLSQLMHENHRAVLVGHDALLGWVDDQTLVERVHQDLASARSQSQMQLVERVVELDGQGGAVSGVIPALRALTEHRVKELIIAPPESPTLGAYGHDPLEDAVCEALQGRASVVTVDGEAAERMQQLEGVAAELRW